jgi:hypothetical protein
MDLPIGYSVLEVAPDWAILFSSRDVISPETGAYRGKRRVAGFNPNMEGVELAIETIAYADSEGGAPTVTALIQTIRGGDSEVAAYLRDREV